MKRHSVSTWSRLVQSCVPGTNSTRFEREQAGLAVLTVNSGRLPGALLIALCVAIPSSSVAQSTPAAGQTSKPASQSGKSPVTPVAPPAKAPADAKPPAAQDLNKQGLDLMKAGKTAEAAALFQQAVTAYPKDIQSYINLAGALDQLKRYDDAIAAYHKAIALNPRFPAFHDGLASLLLEAGKPAQAEQEFDTALGMDTADLRALGGIGDAYDREHELAAARDAYLRALGRMPDSAAIHDNLGNVYEELADHRASMEEFDAALRIDPNDTVAIAGRATALVGLNRASEGESAMRAVVAKSPSDAAAHSGLASVLDAAGDHAGAISEYQAALKITPNDPYLFGNLGWAQYGAGDYDAAAASTEKALQIDGTLMFARLNLGLIYAAKGDWQKSEAAYNTALATASRGDIRSGLDDIEHALEKHPAAGTVRRAQELLEKAERKSLGMES